MALYAIGDLHLSASVDKPMGIFGSGWENHEEKLIAAFSKLNSDDTTVICGDLSWGMNIQEAREDFLFIHRLPGKKIVLKGNHDYWWSTAAKARSFFAENDIDSIEVLYNNCFLYDENTAICGTKGWFYEEETGSEHDKKIMNRELIRLETSLKAAQQLDKYVFLHYPPIHGSYHCHEITDMLEAYGVKACYAGHIHGRGLRAAFEGDYRGVKYRLVSADFLNFCPAVVIN